MRLQRAAAVVWNGTCGAAIPEPAVALRESGTSGALGVSARLAGACTPRTNGAPAPWCSRVHDALALADRASRVTAADS